MGKRAEVPILGSERPSRPALDPAMTGSFPSFSMLHFPFPRMGKRLARACAGRTISPAGYALYHAGDTRYIPCGICITSRGWYALDPARGMR
jgi:hypothetical protein